MPSHLRLRLRSAVARCSITNAEPAAGAEKLTFVEAPLILLVSTPPALRLRGAKPLERAASVFIAKVIVYIDGFNLYYRALQKPHHKWLNVQALAEALFPDDDLQAVKYFTAKIQPSKIDPRKHVRQQVYFRALQTLPKVELHYGNYITNCAKMPLYDDWKQGIKTLVRVAKQEEKGTDVNIASHLLRDAFRGSFEVAGVLTSDSDLAEPFRIVTQELGMPLILLHPFVADASGVLREPARRLRIYTDGRIKKVREGLLAASQLPEKLTDAHGQITRPFEWAISPT